MLVNIADTRVEAMPFANRESLVGAVDGFGVATETRQRKNTRYACPDDREQVTPVQSDRHALLGDRKCPIETSQRPQSHFRRVACDDGWVGARPGSLVSAIDPIIQLDGLLREGQ